MPDSFTTVFGLSAIVSLIWLGWSPSELARRVGSSNHLLLAGASVLLGSLIGARLVYTWVHWGYFKNHLAEILVVWEGGLSGFGGVIGGLATVYFFALLGKASFWELADALARPVTIMSLAIWSGCWLTDCAYGKPVSWGIIRPDIFGQETARWPAALLAAYASAAWAFALPWIEKWLARRTAGWIASITLAWMGLIMLVTSVLRGDPTLLYGDIRQETWAAGIVIMLALASLLIHTKSTKGVHHS